MVHCTQIRFPDNLVKIRQASGRITVYSFKVKVNVSITVKVMANVMVKVMVMFLCTQIRFPQNLVKNSK